MTAGSGVIHNEDSEPLGPTRILQLWLTLPQSARWSEPRFELIRRDAVPVVRKAGVEARVYSGTSGSLRAATHNHVPVTLIDVRLEPGAEFEQDLPNSYNGFLLVLDGSVFVGKDGQRVGEGQVAWLDEAVGELADDSGLRFIAGDAGARVMLYAGERQNVPIVMHGPFVGESRKDLMRLSQLYLDGKMPRMSELAT